MLTNTNLKSNVDSLWNRFWSGGISNPLTAIEQMSYLIFLKRQEHNYNADQSRFLRTVQTVFMQKRKLEEADLYEAPFTNFGSNAVEKYFTQEEIEELMELTKKLAA